MKVKTGDVFQVNNSKGQNYIALGRATVNGETVVIATSNGNIKLNGQSKIGSPVVRRKSAGLGKVGTRLVLHAFAPSKIYKIHDNRTVDLKTVWTRGNADEQFRTQVKRINVDLKTA